MYKKYIELKSWWRIWIKPKNQSSSELDLQITIFDKQWNIIIESDILDQRTALRIIELFVQKSDIKDSVESIY